MNDDGTETISSVLWSQASGEASFFLSIVTVIFALMPVILSFQPQAMPKMLRIFPPEDSGPAT